MAIFLCILGYIFLFDSKKKENKWVLQWYYCEEKKNTGKKRVTIRMSYVTKKRRWWIIGGYWFDDIPWEFIFSIALTSPHPYASYQYVSVQMLRDCGLVYNPNSPVIQERNMRKEKENCTCDKKNVIGKIEWFFYCFFDLCFSPLSMFFSFWRKNSRVNFFLSGITWGSGGGDPPFFCYREWMCVCVLK